jgi:hypothetical protein
VRERVIAPEARHVTTIRQTTALVKAAGRVGRGGWCLGPISRGWCLRPIPQNEFRILHFQSKKLAGIQDTAL